LSTETYAFAELDSKLSLSLELNRTKADGRQVVGRLLDPNGRPLEIVSPAEQAILR
jgi:hypothetical protein